MSTPTPARRPSRRVLAIAGAAVAVVLVALGVWLASSDPDEPGSSAAATSSSEAPASPGEQPSVAPTNPPTPEPSGPTGDATEGPGTVAPVGLTDTAEVGDGVSGRLVSVEAIQGDGDGPGNIDGPALRVTVELVNGTSKPVSFDAVAAELYTGQDLTPASPLDDPSAAPFSGTVAPGDSATGVYVFTVPEDRRSDVTVQVGYQAGAPYLVFRGAAD